MPSGGAVHIEDIQDHVELSLMRAGEHKIARSYVLYREERSRERKAAAEQAPLARAASSLSVTLPDGSSAPLDENRLRKVIDEACGDIDGAVGQAVLDETLRSLFDGVAETDVARAATMSSTGSTRRSRRSRCAHSKARVAPMLKPNSTLGRSSSPPRAASSAPTSSPALEKAGSRIRFSRPGGWTGQTSTDSGMRACQPR